MLAELGHKAHTLPGDSGRILTSACAEHDRTPPCPVNTGGMPQTSESPEFPPAGNRCPCTSGLTFGECCGRWIVDGLPAPTAVQLMRSRFTAFAIADDRYLLATWHASTRPDELDLDQTIRWTRLDILRTEQGGPLERTGVVEFAAYYRHDGERGIQQEVSSFLREGGRWSYVAAVD